ncbi:ribonuclease H-like domain-containing protein [Halobacterium bonnevillei]|uniref:ribonuclease H-like domain-containing protein n=1 Tax=Halobacterium bonnevillei TaxID=2692200 RepID=UPI0019155271|nr:ribonuclease H-like domain-containing protein [Halobacterium bonnevillei]
MQKQCHTLETPVQCSLHDSEQELLNELATFVTSTFTQRDAKLVAYNGERWNGGFDLPFFRTRLCTHGLEWPFGTLPSVDVMDVFETRFNTSEGTLSGVYEELIGAKLNELDPFTDSCEAVTAWKESAYELLITHNVADIRRTRALMELAERYCSKSDFTMKPLEPIV